MRAFLVNGSERSFADVITEQRGLGLSCMVASYGFGVKQVERIISNFNRVTLIADSSHAQLNPRAYERVVALDETLDTFNFIPTKIHAKFAIINGDTVIFTSANLSANRRVEVYLIGCKGEVDGVNEVISGLGSPGGIFSEPTAEFLLHSDFDPDGDISFDWDAI